MMEENLRRAPLPSRGEPRVLFARPRSRVIGRCAAGAGIVAIVLPNFRDRREVPFLKDG